MNPMQPTELTISGIVMQGQKRGRTFGFPTANFLVDESVSDGIYLSRAHVENEWLPSLTFIGAARTVGNTEWKAECYILDFAGELYGIELIVRLIKKIRENEMFDSKEALLAAMKQDESDARDYFQNN